MAEGVTEQATFPMFPNEQLLFAARPNVGRSRRTLYLDVDHVNIENLSMSSVIRGINVENIIQNKAYGILINRYPLPVAMSTKQASFNVLTDKDRSVRPWRSRFNLVSQCLTTFHMWWSGFPPLHGNISWGPISSFLESAQILWSHVAYQQYHGSSYKVMSRTPKYHSMSSLPKIVLSALEDLVSIWFLKVWQHFTCDDMDFHHCMATFHEDLYHGGTRKHSWQVQQYPSFASMSRYSKATGNKILFVVTP